MLNNHFTHRIFGSAHRLSAKIKASPLAQRIITGSFWALIGAVTLRASRLISSIFVAQFLGKTGFGEFGIIQSTIGLFGAFAGFGMGVTATKYIAEFREKHPRRAGRIMGLTGVFTVFTGGIMSLGLFLFAPLLSAHALAAPHLSGTLRIGALFLFLTTLNGAQQGALAGFEAFKSIAIVNFLVGVLSLPLIIGGVYLGGVQGAVVGLTLSVAVHWILNHAALRKKSQQTGVPFVFMDAWREWPILWKFSLPAVLAGIMVGPVNWYCATLLVNQENGYAQMGAYNAALQWCSLLLFLPGILGQVIVPILSERLGNKDRKQSLKVLSISIKTNMIIVWPLIILFSVFSRSIMGLYGAEFGDEWLLLVIVLITTGLVAIANPLGDYLVAGGRLWLGFSLNLAWGVAFILGTILWVGIGMGGMGLAAARLAAYLMHGFWIWMLILYLTKKM